MAEALSLSRQPGGPHHFLSRLHGHWTGHAQTWFEPGVLADSSAITGSFHPVVDGLFTAHEYQSTLNGEPMIGLAIFGFDLKRRKFTMTWRDTCHMGTSVMLAEGDGDPIAGKFSVKGHYDVPNAEPWGWRVDVELRSEEVLVIVHHNITPAGQEARAVEIHFERSTKGKKH